MGHGVSAWRQNEDERDGAVGVAVGLDQIEGRRLDELLAQVALDELGDCHCDLVGADAADDDHLLELVDRVVVGVGKGGQLRVLAVEQLLLPLVRVGAEVLVEAF